MYAAVQDFVSHTREAIPFKQTKFEWFLTILLPIYFLLVITSIYGEWLFAWSLLGHIPIPSLNDPKSVTGLDWAHSTSDQFGAYIDVVTLATIIANACNILILKPPSSVIVYRLAGLILPWFFSFCF
ncbi:MAG: hypothetical protein ABI579_04560 [Candidatus Sumerlaeota bacterium]